MPGNQWPAELKGNRLGRSQRPAIVGCWGVISGHDDRRGQRRNFHLFAGGRRKAHAQRKPVNECACDDPLARYDCRESDRILPGHRLSPSVAGLGYRDDLPDRHCGYARAIDVTAERLRLAHASPPIARRFAGQLPERGGEGGLGGIAKLRRDRHDRRVGVAQHVHGLLESVLAQPGVG